MPRAAAQQASQAAGTAGANAATSFGPLNAGAQALTRSTGYDPATLSAITNAGMGGVNASFGDAASQIKRNAALTKNPAGTAGQLDTLAQNKGLAGGQEAGNIQIQNADFANQQRMAGLNLLNSMYGTSTGAQAPLINAETNASPGWAQTLSGIAGGVGSAASGLGNAVKAIKA